MYSDRLTELFHDRRHAGRLETFTHYGEAGIPGQGPSTRLWLRVVNGRVEAASYQTYGCPAIIGCMEALCRYLVGRNFSEAEGITADQVVTLIGGVPEEKQHCPVLAAEALAAGLEEH